LQNRLMGEVREATSPSGGVSRRADVAKGAKRISPHRFGALRGRGLESTNFQFSTNVAKPFFYLLIYTFQTNKKWFLRNRSTKVEFST
ncbi:hypothetical protein PG593_10995, partial [Riemerella anatipestifer]|nr:hypothetical protein [Riemerella anatipestifer]